MSNKSNKDKALEKQPSGNKQNQKKISTHNSNKEAHDKNNKTLIIVNDD